MIRALVAAALAGFTAGGVQSPSTAGIGRAAVLDNATVTVARLVFAPNAMEPMHTHAFPTVIVQLSAGSVTIADRDMLRIGNKAGEVWFVPANARHAARNMGARATVLLAVALKPDRAPAPSAPPTEPPPGIARATLVDNADVRIARVRFEPDGREPVHTHPTDLLTVQITTGKVEILNGSERTIDVREPGYVRFLPRNVPHAYASADTKAFTLLSIAIK